MKNKTKSELFLYFCFIFIAGVGIASFLPIDLIKNNLWWFLAAIFFLFLYVVLSGRKKRIIALFIFIIFLSFFRYSASIPNVSSGKIQFYNGKNLTIIGTVASEPENRQKSQRFILKTKELYLKENEPQKNVRGKVLVTTDSFPVFNYGDILKIDCKLKIPEKIENFSYDRYLAKSGIYSMCYSVKIEKTAENGGNMLYLKILETKNLVRKIIVRGLPYDESNLARAIVLGDKYAISDIQSDIFSYVGVSHMMAISGMHIGVIFMLLVVMLLSVGFRRSQIFYAGLIILFLYVILIGAPASAMRAFFMIALVLLAQKIERLSSIDRSVYFAAVILLLINPKLLRDDVGFQLSFLAILAIIYLYPIFDDFFERKKIYKLRLAANILSLTAAIQFFTMPILVLNFKQFSLIAPFANLLIIWSLPFLIFLIFIAVLFSVIFPFFANVFFLPAYILLVYIFKVSEFFSIIPFAYLKIDNVFFVLPFYLFTVVIFIKKRANKSANLI